MKTIQKIIASLFILFSISTISAQYGNSYGNNGYGGNRIGQMNQESDLEKPKEIPVEVKVSKIMERMTPELNLDELQVIAISNILKESIDSQGRVLKQETNQEEQTNNFKIISENTDRKILELLNKEQKEKFILFKEDIKKPKKEKDKSKKKQK